MENDNYMIIQGWMINELCLKGNELIIYALIYGFSQDGRSRFTGSLQYISEWTGTSKQTVISCIKNLVDKGLIDKKEKIINGVKFNEYCAITEVFKKNEGYSKNFNGVVKNFDQGYSKNLTGGSQKILPNNNINNNINNNNNKEKIYKKENKELIENLKSRINKLFNRRETTQWTDKEIQQFKVISKRTEVFDELNEIENLYNSGYKYRRRDIITFLNNFSIELDRARNKQSSCNNNHSGSVDSSNRNTWWNGEVDYDRNLTDGF